jgi:hypothetical protein
MCFAEDHADEAVTLERLLLGEWRGPACGGDWTYNADGTFAVRSFSPGGNQLTGSWEVRWTTLPPTLVQTFLTSDEPDLVGQVWESRIVQLDDATLATQAPDQLPAGQVVHYTRLSAAEALCSKLHGDWQGGELCVGELTFEPDGTFERRHYSPGDNQLAGTWEVNWNSLPLVVDLACESSDDPDQIGQTDQFQIVRLDDEVLVLQRVGGSTISYDRAGE